jgi:hypothetical protein
MEDQKTKRAAIDKFLRPEPKALTDRAVEQELKRIRPQFNFTAADLRRLRQPRRRHVA